MFFVPFLEEKRGLRVRLCPKLCTKLAQSRLTFECFEELRLHVLAAPAQTVLNIRLVYANNVREGRLKLGTGLGGSQVPVTKAKVKKNEAQLANSRTSSAIFGILA